MTTPSTPDPSPATAGRLRVGSPERAALEAALAGEHAAVYAYGVVGGQAGSRYRTAASERLAWHSRQREILSAQLVAAGIEPQPGAAAYALPFPVTGVTDARRLAAHVEQSLAATYADVVAAAPGPRRRAAASLLAACAVQARRWGAVPHPFPGLPERQ
jgi:hypothetical protein